VGDLAGDLHKRGRDRLEADRSGTPEERRAEAETARELLRELDRLELLDPDAIEQFAAQRRMAEDTVALGEGGAAVVRLTQQPRAPLTDYGNAERLAEDHAEALRFVPGPGWISWDRRRWAPDSGGGAPMRAAKATARLIRDEARELDDEELAKKVFGHAVKSESHPRLVAALKLAESEESLIARVEELDSDPWAFNVWNGTIDLETGELRPHDRADLITKLSPVEHDPAAKCPRWDAFLRDVFSGDEELIHEVQKMTGYTLVGVTTEQLLLFAYGHGGNGKSTFMTVLRALFGEYGEVAPVGTLMAKRADAIPNDLAKLRGARLVTTAETGQDQHLDEVLIKEATGGDPLAARFLHKEWFTYKPSFTIWMAGNHRPRVRGGDDAIWDRIRLVPFEQRIRGTDREVKGLGDQLLGELPGVLNWALEGCRLWQSEGLRTPAAVKAATESYRAGEDTVGAFLAARCVKDPDAKASVGDLFVAYEHFCGGVEREPLSRDTFGRRLEDAGHPPKKGPKGVRIREGLRLL